MKKIIIPIFAFAATLILFSCTKEKETIIESTFEETNVEYITLSVNTLESIDTKTYVDGTSIKWASSGEKLKVFEDADGTVAASTSKAGETTDSGATMTFQTQLVDKSSESIAAFTYYAFYPSSAYASHTGVETVAINTSANQTPTATSFDPSADLLIAQKVEAGDTQPTSLNMAFARMVAIGKMTITNLGTTDVVKSVSFSAQVSNGVDYDDVVIAGRTAFNLTTAMPKTVYGSNVDATTINLDYSALSLTANSSMDAWFTCFPFSLASGDKFTVVVKTDENTYTKTVTIPDARELTFTEGKASRFTVSMSGIVGVPNTQNIPFAYLSYDEAVSIGGLTGSYGDHPYTDTYGGGKWQLNAYKNAEKLAIQLKNNDATSYIKLPLFEDNIRKIIVKIPDITSGSLYFDSSKGVKTGSIFQATDPTSEGEYTYTATDFGTIKTAYIHAVGGTAYISSIEVYAGDDNAEDLATPTDVTAALTSDGGSGHIANSVTVGWTAVSHADYYIVTLTPTPSGSTVSTKVTTNSAILAELAFEKEYAVSVVAHAKNKGLYNASTAGTCANVTTDKAPGIAVDDILFRETWGSYTGAVDSYGFTGTTTYSGVKTSLSYTSSHASSNVQATTAGVVTSNNFFFYNGASTTLTMTGIPLEKGVTELELSFVTNKTTIKSEYKIDSGSWTTLEASSTNGDNSQDITGISPSATSISLRFTNTNTKANARLDNIILTVTDVE